jgi:F-box/leucine-rich repeat protein 2/20
MSLLDYVRDKDILAISTGLLRLKSLNVSHCRKISNAGLMAIAGRLTELESLNINGCRHVGDEVLTAISTGLTNLTTLYLKRCGKIRNEGLEALASGLRKLQSLTVSAYSQTYEDSGKAPPLLTFPTGFTQLKSLDLSYSFDDERLTAIFTDLNQLQNLRIQYCETGDGLLRSLATGLTQLQVLTVTHLLTHSPNHLLTHSVLGHRRV